MLDLLRAHDAQIVEMTCSRGSVLIPPALHGRIFCQLDGELIHRLDVDALKHPSSTEYNNLGGNSLWPAPEGGPYAFNYPPEDGGWRVQDGIAKSVPEVRRVSNGCALVEKHITLTNRKGVNVRLGYRRLVSVPDAFPLPEGYGLEGMCYRTGDVFEPFGDYAPGEVLLAPWSLEQFPGAEGILAFGKVEEGSDAINADFYGPPGKRIQQGAGQFTFRLGGGERHQIGVKTASRPRLIGALDARRSLLLLRKTCVESGLYFNIADNEQAGGPFSAADAYSIFNGGDLGFFELETVGALRVFEGRLAPSVLTSQTTILRGDVKELRRYLAEQEGVHLE